MGVRVDPMETLVVPLLNAFNAQYIARLAVGDPQGILQWFTVIPDTGSRDVWLPGVECLGQGAFNRPRSCPPSPVLDSLPWSTEYLPIRRNLYNISKSALTAHSTGDQRRLRYGDGTIAEAIGVRDTLNLQGAYGNGLRRTRRFLTLNERKFSRVIDYASPRSVMIADGIMGLGLSPPDSSILPLIKGGTAFIDQLFEEGNLQHYASFYYTNFNPSLLRQKPTTSTKWSHWQDSVWERQSSAMILGWPDWSHFSRGQIFWTKMPPGFKDGWFASLLSLGLAKTGFKVDLTRERRYREGTPALVDTGTSLIVLRRDLWTSWAEQFRASAPQCQIVTARDSEDPVMWCPCRTWFKSLVHGVFHREVPIPTLELTFASNETDLPFSLCIPAEDLLMREPKANKCRLGSYTAGARQPTNSCHTWRPIHQKLLHYSRRGKLSHRFCKIESIERSASRMFAPTREQRENSWHQQ